MKAFFEINKVELVGANGGNTVIHLGDGLGKDLHEIWISTDKLEKMLLAAKKEEMLRVAKEMIG